MKRRVLGSLVLALLPSFAVAQSYEIPNFRAIQAAQEGELWCWAAALQIAAAAQGVTLSQQQIVNNTNGVQPAATYDDMLRFLRAGWRGPVGDPNTWTVDSDSFRGAAPDVMMARFFGYVKRPVIIAYRTGPSSAHAVVAYGGEWTRGEPPRLGDQGLTVSRDNDDRFRTLRIYDPATGETTPAEDWDKLRRSVIGTWVPIITSRRPGSNVF